MPASVQYTKPPIPDAASDAKGTSKALEAYEDASQKNEFAIQQAQKHNKRLQKLYNSK